MSQFLTPLHKQRYAGGMTTDETIPQIVSQLSKVRDVALRRIAAFEGALEDGVRPSHSEVREVCVTARSGVEALIKNTLYMPDWVQQISHYAAARKCIAFMLEEYDDGHMNLKEVPRSLQFTIDTLQGSRAHDPRPLGDDIEKYSAGLYVISMQIADWAERTIPKLSHESTLCRSGLISVIQAVGELNEYILWLDYLGHSRLANRIDSKYRSILRLAHTLDEAAKECIVRKDKDNSEKDGIFDTIIMIWRTGVNHMERFVFELGDIVASVAILLGSPTYNLYYHNLDGIVPTRPTDRPTFGQKKTANKRRRLRRKPSSLTPKQTEAFAIVQECKGNIAEAARRLGLDYSTVKQHYDVACEKAGYKAAKPKTTRLRHDKRGQVNIAKEDDLHLE